MSAKCHKQTLVVSNLDSFAAVEIPRKIGAISVNDLNRRTVYFPFRGRGRRINPHSAHHLAARAWAAMFVGRPELHPWPTSSPLLTDIVGIGCSSRRSP